MVFTGTTGTIFTGPPSFTGSTPAGPTLQSTSAWEDVREPSSSVARCRGQCVPANSVLRIFDERMQRTVAKLGSTLVCDRIELTDNHSGAKNTFELADALNLISNRFTPTIDSSVVAENDWRDSIDQCDDVLQQHLPMIALRACLDDSLRPVYPFPDYSAASCAYCSSPQSNACVARDNGDGNACVPHSGECLSPSDCASGFTCLPEVGTASRSVCVARGPLVVPICPDECTRASREVFEKCVFLTNKPAMTSRDAADSYTFRLSCGSAPQVPLPCLSLSTGTVVPPMAPLAVPRDRTFWSDFADKSQAEWTLYSFDTGGPNAKERFPPAVLRGNDPLAGAQQGRLIPLSLGGQSVDCSVEADTYLFKQLVCSGATSALVSAVRNRPETQGPGGGSTLLSRSPNQNAVFRNADNAIVRVDGRSLSVRVDGEANDALVLDFVWSSLGGNNVWYRVRGEPQFVCLRSVDFLSPSRVRGVSTRVPSQVNFQPCTGSARWDSDAGSWDISDEAQFAYGTSVLSNVGLRGLFGLSKNCLSWTSDAFVTYPDRPDKDEFYPDDCFGWFAFGNANPEELTVSSTLGAAAGGLIGGVILLVLCVGGGAAIFLLCRKKRSASHA